MGLIPLPLPHLCLQGGSWDWRRWRSGASGGVIWAPFRKRFSQTQTHSAPSGFPGDDPSWSRLLLREESRPSPPHSWPDGWTRRRGFRAEAKWHLISDQTSCGFWDPRSPTRWSAASVWLGLGEGSEVCRVDEASLLPGSLPGTPPRLLGPSWRQCPGGTESKATPADPLPGMRGHRPSAAYPHPAHEQAPAPGETAERSRAADSGRGEDPARRGQTRGRPAPQLQPPGSSGTYIPFFPSPEVNSFGKYSCEMRPR